MTSKLPGERREISGKLHHHNPGERYFKGWEDAAGTIAKYEQDGMSFKVRSTRT